MKKLSDLYGFLSRDEMKKIQGGGLGDEFFEGNSYCYCNNEQEVNVPDCGWCESVCGIRGGYKGVCLTFG